MTDQKSREQEALGVEGAALPDDANSSAVIRDLDRLKRPPHLERIREKLRCEGTADADLNRALIPYLADLAEEIGALEQVRGGRMAVALAGNSDEAFVPAAQAAANAVLDVVMQCFNEGLRPDAAAVFRALEQVAEDEQTAVSVMCLIQFSLQSPTATPPLAKRRYRRRSELPDPSQPAGAEVNRPTVQVKLRVAPAVVEMIDKAVQRAGDTRSEWVAEAALQRIERDDPELL